MGLAPPSRVHLLDIARAAIVDRLMSRASADRPSSDGMPVDPDLTSPAGCFVSLHDRDSHRLRGCVGRIDVDQPLWKVVKESAERVLADPRFTTRSVTAGDIPNLELEISVLSPPREAESPLDFDPLADGIYLSCGGQVGFFLPQVARETGWTKEQLLERLCTEKLSLPSDAWQRPEARLLKFNVEVIGPEPL